MRKETDVLIVIDVQNDFCPGGSLAVPGGDEIVHLVNRLAHGFSHVVLTQDWHPAGHSSFASTHPGKAPFEMIDMPYGPQTLWPDHCVQATDGAAFHKDLDIPHAELIIRKGFRKDTNRARRLSQGTRLHPCDLRRLGLRFLRSLFGRRRSQARFRH